jgi:hypothetical protein
LFQGDTVFAALDSKGSGHLTFTDGGLGRFDEGEHSVFGQLAHMRGQPNSFKGIFIGHARAFLLSIFRYLCLHKRGSVFVKSVDLFDVLKWAPVKNLSFFKPFQTADKGNRVKSEILVVRGFLI